MRNNNIKNVKVKKHFKGYYNILSIGQKLIIGSVSKEDIKDIIKNKKIEETYFRKIHIFYKFNDSNNYEDFLASIALARLYCDYNRVAKGSRNIIIHTDNKELVDRILSTLALSMCITTRMSTCFRYNDEKFISISIDNNNNLKYGVLKHI